MKMSLIFNQVPRLKGIPAPGLGGITRLHGVPVGAEPGWQPAHNVWPGGLFNGFTNLRTLQLQSNQLVRLPPKLFQTLGKVRWAFSEL